MKTIFYSRRCCLQKTKKKKKKSESFNFSALHLVNDAQGLAERLYKKLETLNERYEVG